MKTMPSCASFAEKSAFSLKNPYLEHRSVKKSIKLRKGVPYPGCTAWCRESAGINYGKTWNILGHRSGGILRLFYPYAAGGMVMRCMYVQGSAHT